MSQQQLQHLVMHALTGHVKGTTPPPVMKVYIGAVEQEQPGGVVAAMEGREEQRSLALREWGYHNHNLSLSLSL